MKYVYCRDYLKKYLSLSAGLKSLVLRTDEQIKAYYENQLASFGLRIKKLGARTYEARVNDRIRIVWLADEQEIIFALLGSHDEVRCFIKKL